MNANLEQLFRTANDMLERFLSISDGLSGSNQQFGSLVPLISKLSGPFALVFWGTVVLVGLRLTVTLWPAIRGTWRLIAALFGLAGTTVGEIVGGIVSLFGQPATEPAAAALPVRTDASLWLQARVAFGRRPSVDTESWQPRPLDQEEMDFWTRHLAC